MARLPPSRGLAAARARSRPSRPRAGVRGARAPQLPRLRVVRARRAVRRRRGGAARVRRVRANQAGGGGPGVSLADELAQLLPNELSFEDGADLAQMLPIAVNAVAYAEERHAGAPTVVFGCGPVGLILSQVARATGATTVYAVDRIPQRLTIAKSLGLVPLDAGAEDVARKLKSAHGADGIPVAFECSGSARALNEATRVVRRRGTVVAVGFYQGEAAGLFLGDEFHHNGVEIRSGQIGNLHPRWGIGALRAFGIDLVRRKTVILGGLPRLSLPVEQAASAFGALARPAEVLQVALSYTDA